MPWRLARLTADLTDDDAWLGLARGASGGPAEDELFRVAAGAHAAQVFDDTRCLSRRHGVTSRLQARGRTLRQPPRDGLGPVPRLPARGLGAQARRADARYRQGARRAAHKGRLSVRGRPPSTIDHARALASMREAWEAEGKSLFAGPDVPSRRAVYGERRP